MHFKTVLRISLTLMGVVTFAEAGLTQSKPLRNNEEGEIAVEDANRQKNPFLELRRPETFESDGEDMTVECMKGPLLSEELRQWISRLMETNLKKLYKKTPREWNLEAKMNGITDAAARVLIVRTSSGQPVGFAHFRFEMDQITNEEVVDCRELEVEESMRERGIGRYLVDVQTRFAEHFNMRKSTATVLETNERAYDLFINYGFSIDDTSPEKSIYLLLSKYNVLFD